MSTAAVSESLRAFAAALEGRFRAEGSVLVQRLREVAYARRGVGFEAGEPRYYIPLPGEEYWYLGIKHTPPSGFVVEGPLRKDMYGLMRVFRPMRSRDSTPPDLFPRTLRLIEELRLELVPHQNLGSTRFSPAPSP